MDFALVTEKDGTQNVVPRDAIKVTGDKNAFIGDHHIMIEGYNKNFQTLYDIANCHNKRRLNVILEKHLSCPRRSNVDAPNTVPDEAPRTLSLTSSSTCIAPTPPIIDGKISTVSTFETEENSTSFSPVCNAPETFHEILRTISPTFGLTSIGPTPSIIDDKLITLETITEESPSSFSPVGNVPETLRTLSPTSSLQLIIDDNELSTVSTLETIIEVNPTSFSPIRNVTVHHETPRTLFATSNPDETSKNVHKRRIFNKPNICKFCRETKTNIKRHIMSVHSDEEEVKSFMMLSEDNPKKRELLSQIRRDGNFAAFKDEQEIIPCRISKYSEPEKNDYRVCPKCKILLKKYSLTRHLKKYCPKNPTKSTDGMLFRSKALSQTLHKGACSTFRDYIFPSFREGNAKEIIRFDSLLITYANEMCYKYRSQHHYAMIRNRLLRMVKLFMLMKTKNPSLQWFKDILKPQMFDSIVECINEIGEYNEVTGNYMKPTLTTELGTALKYLIELYISECIKCEDDVGKSSAKNLLHLLKTALPAHVNKTAAESLLQLKRKKLLVLPSKDDIEKLDSHLLENMSRYYKSLKKEFDLDSWLNLSSYTLINILVFNRRRPGELERSLISDLQTMTSLEDKGSTTKLNEEDRQYVKGIKRFVIRGKLARGVPVLLNETMYNSLELVLKYRDCAGVLKENPYIFGLPQCRGEEGNNTIFRHLIATNLIRKYSVECGASDPRTLRATTLRKHVATESMSMNLNNEDVEQLQRYLGHEDKIHRQFYRQPNVEKDILTISKILRAAQRTSHNDERPSSSIIAPSTSTVLQPSTSFIARATTPTSVPGTPPVSRTPSVNRTPPEFHTPEAGPSNDFWNSSPLAGPAHALYDPTRSSGSEYNPSGESSSDDAILDEIPSTPKRQRIRLLNMSPGHASIKRRWTTPERHSAGIFFKQNILKKKVPTSREIEEVVKKCPELRNRTVPQIKMWVANQNQSKRAKKSWGTPARQIIKREFQRFIEGDSSYYPPKNLVDEVIQKHGELKHLSPRRIRSQIQQQKKKFRQSLFR